MPVEHQNLTMILFQYFSCVFKIKFRRAVQMITNMIYIYIHAHSIQKFYTNSYIVYKFTLNYSSIKDPITIIMDFYFLFPIEKFKNVTLLSNVTYSYIISSFI